MNLDRLKDKGKIDLHLRSKIVRMYLTKSIIIIIRDLSKKQYNVLVDISLKVNELRNCAVEETNLIKASDEKHYAKTNYMTITS